jgi:YidC/Oxa1 family membrane protein insertase
MNDIRRTILWVIFGFSMVMLWDNYQVSVGNKATFGLSSKPTAAPANTPTTPSAPATAGATSAPSAIPATASATPNAINSIATQAINTPATVQNSITAAPAAQKERFEVSTDVIKLTFDTEGGSLVRSEFVKHVELEDRAAVKAGTAKNAFTWRKPAWSAHPACLRTKPS